MPTREELVEQLRHRANGLHPPKLVLDRNLMCDADDMIEQMAQRTDIMEHQIQEMAQRIDGSVKILSLENFK